MGNTSPVARYSPAKGIIIDQTGHSIAISGKMAFYGPEATTARAQSIEYSINTIWRKDFPDGYSVACDISVAFLEKNVVAANASQIEALKMRSPSHVNVFTREMTLNANEALAFTWLAAHEFGHVLGLKDRYSESIISSIKGAFGGQRHTPAHPGYEHNLMAAKQGVLENRNLGDLIEENAVSAYWINDDNRVRDWVTHHKSAEIEQISSSNKLAMIKTLMSGWISDDDIQAISRICACVTTKKEADLIRSKNALRDISNVGQRMRIMVAFDRMPK